MSITRNMEKKTFSIIKNVLKSYPKSDPCKIVHRCLPPLGISGLASDDYLTFNIKQYQSLPGNLSYLALCILLDIYMTVKPCQKF